MRSAPSVPLPVRLGGKGRETSREQPCIGRLQIPRDAQAANSCEPLPEVERTRELEPGRTGSSPFPTTFLLWIFAKHL